MYDNTHISNMTYPYVPFLTDGNYMSGYAIDREDMDFSYPPWLIFCDSLQVMPLIMTTLLSISLAQLLCQHLPVLSVRRFVLEFIVIVVPTVCNYTVTSDYNELYCIGTIVLIAVLLWRNGTWRRIVDAAPGHYYEVGRRPTVITVLRSATYVCTSCAILAVDFEAFPNTWRKSRRYGSTLMDVGIGMFVLTLGMVSHRTQHLTGVNRMLRSALPTLMIGCARNVFVGLLSYDQDVHEYGRDWNALFTIGFTKLLGGLTSMLVRSERQLMPLSIVILFLHEMALQMGLANYVMSNASRDNMFSANREGLSALPGCVALYLLGMWGGYWYRSRDRLNHTQFLDKLRFMTSGGLFIWILVGLSALSFDIARVTFNAGYVIWVFGLGTMMLLLSSFIFEFCLMEPQTTIDGVQGACKSMPASVPIFAKVINFNGRIYFLISKLFTCLINIVLVPKERSDAECVAILILYMLSSYSIIYILYRKLIRIA